MVVWITGETESSRRVEKEQMRGRCLLRVQNGAQRASRIVKQGNRQAGLFPESGDAGELVVRVGADGYEIDSISICVDGPCQPLVEFGIRLVLFVAFAFERDKRER